MQKNIYSVKRNPYMFTLRINVYFSGRTKIPTAPPENCTFYPKPPQKNSTKGCFSLLFDRSAPPPLLVQFYIWMFSGLDQQCNIALFGKVYRTIFKNKRRRLVLKTGVIMYIQSYTYTNTKYIFTYIYICCKLRHNINIFCGNFWIDILQNITRHPNLKAPVHFSEIPCTRTEHILLKVNIKALMDLVEISKIQNILWSLIRYYTNCKSDKYTA